MRGQDLKQDVIQRRAAANKRAFDDVIGDPFAKPEATTGHYMRFKSRGLIAAMQTDFDKGKTTRNPAAPNAIDFICDVERTVETTLLPVEYRAFVKTYIWETDTTSLTQGQRSELEQRLGQAFRTNCISPVSRYFTSIKRGTKNGNTRNGS